MPAYNAVVLASFPLAAAAAYLLARHLRLSHLIARRGGNGSRWLRSQPVSEGLDIGIRLKDATVFRVTASLPALYTDSLAGFSSREHDAEWSWRWMGVDASWSVINTRRQSVAATLDLELASFERPRWLMLRVDGRDVQTVWVGVSRQFYRSKPLILTPGVHEILFHPLAPPYGGQRRAWQWRPAAAVVRLGPVGLDRGAVNTMSASAYVRFWRRVGESFPDLGGAASTSFYAHNEQRLLTEHLPALDGLHLLKTDLWDEARNTRILAWAAQQGARVYGIDISGPTLALARAAFADGAAPLRSAVADVRALPFLPDSFDAVYSMGTIEHFDDTEGAVAEIVRALKPGGRAIVGVPNRHDPFLRPLLVTLLQAAGCYAYGVEKSYSRRTLRHLLEHAGLTVVAETSILFIPGWLRMLDLAFHAYARPLARVSGALVEVFVRIDSLVPAVRRHGYLLATVGVKPFPQDAAPSHDAHPAAPV